MSLIQEALEKAGRLPAVELKPVPVEEKAPVHEAKVEKIPAAVKSEPFWLVDLKVKLLGLLDKMGIAPAQKEGETRKTAFIAASLVVFFLGAVFYVHTVALKFPAEPLPLPDAVSENQVLTAGVSGEAPHFQLTGVTFSGNVPLALINNQVVGVGEKLQENATVVEIQRKKAVVDFQGQKIELEL